MQQASGIRNKTRNGVLHHAAPVYVDLLSDDHGIGIVAFDDDATVIMQVTWCAFGECLLRDEGVLAWLERLKVDVARLRPCLGEACRGAGPMRSRGFASLLPLVEEALRRR